VEICREAINTMSTKHILSVKTIKQRDMFIFCRANIIYQMHVLVEILNRNDLLDCVIINL
jgi:hypothetical protein